MTEQEKKRQVAKISVFITSIFVIFMSITYAFINQTLTGTKRQVIVSGNLQLKLEEGDSFTLENALPMYDEVGMLQKSFDFTLQNRTDVDINYTLKLVDVTSDVTSKLDTSFVKYGLLKDGAKSIELLSKLKDGVLDTGEISGSQTIEYSLRLWVDSNVIDENLIKGKSLSYRIEVDANQDVVQEFKEPGGTLKVIKYMVPWNTPLCDDDFCSYSKQVTSLVIEPKIDIPSTIDETKLWDVSDEQNGSVMAYLEEDGTLENGDVAYRMHVQGENGVYVNPDSTLLFLSFDKITTIEGLKYLNTSKVTNMNSMFYGCSNLKSLDLNYLDTSNVTDMSHMFFECSNLTDLDLSHFDTSKVIDMNSMFYGCSSLESLDLNHLDTSHVTDMEYMFYGCSSLNSLDISSFDISSLSIRSAFTSVLDACFIYVKDEGAKNRLLEYNSSFENVIIKTI